MKRLVTFLLLIVLCLSTFVGCGKTTNGDEIDLSKYANRSQSVKVTYFSSGYGKKWLQAVAKEYMDNYDSDTYIDITNTVLATEELSKIASGMSTGDVYLLETHMEDVTDKLVELTDLYNQPALGEESSGKTIKDKVDPNLYHIYHDAGKSFMMPYVNQMGYGYAYNKTTLDDAYAGEAYTLPRTTEEFFEMGDYLKSKGKNLYVAAFKDNSDYLVFAWKVWFAQLVGEEAYNNYFEGKFKNEAGEYVFDETAPTVLSKYESEIKSWFNIIRTLGLKSNEYIHSDSNSIDFMNASSVFSGIPFGQNPNEAAFLFTGPWLENEIDFLLEEQISYNDPQEIGCIKMPVASDIIKRTPSIKNDDMLRQVISYVDGDSDVPVPGVTPADIEIVKEARSFVGAVVTGTATIPQAAKNIEGAKKFIRFLASDKAQLVAQQNIKGGLPLLPYGYIANNEELGFERTNYMNDVIKRASDCRLVVSDGQKFNFVRHGNFSFSYQDANFLKEVFSGTDATALTADAYYKNYYDTFDRDWAQKITGYKLAMGDSYNQAIGKA